MGLAQFAQPTLLLFQSLLLVLGFVEELLFSQLDVLPVPAVGQQQRFRHFFAQLRRQKVRILIIKDSLPIVLYILSPFDLYS